jgi:hypothetical protein
MSFWGKSPILFIFGKITIAINEKKRLFSFSDHKTSDLLIKKLPDSTSGSSKIANDIQGCLNVFYFPIFSIAKFG